MRNSGRSRTPAQPVYSNGSHDVMLKPVGVARVLAVLYHVLKRRVLCADVVENAIDDHVEAHGVGLLNEMQEELVGLGPLPRGRIEQVLARGDLVVVALGAEVVVYVHVAEGVVLVVRRGLEDRVEVQRVHTQVAHVRQRLFQTGQITAIETVKDGELVERLPVGRFPGRGGEPLAGPGSRILRVIAGVAVAEAIHHDLVPDGMLGPIGGLEHVYLRKAAYIRLGAAEALAVVGEDERVLGGDNARSAASTL